MTRRVRCALQKGTVRYGIPSSLCPEYARHACLRRPGKAGSRNCPVQSLIPMRVRWAGYSFQPMLLCRFVFHRYLRVGISTGRRAPRASESARSQAAGAAFSARRENGGRRANWVFN
jgi:hypothetical protein